MTDYLTEEDGAAMARATYEVLNAVAARVAAEARDKALLEAAHAMPACDPNSDWCPCNAVVTVLSLRDPDVEGGE